jgi:hypothetical protein
LAASLNSCPGRCVYSCSRKGGGWRGRRAERRAEMAMVVVVVVVLSYAGLGGWAGAPLHVQPRTRGSSRTESFRSVQTFWRGGCACTLRHPPPSHPAPAPAFSFFFSLRGRASTTRTGRCIRLTTPVPTSTDLHTPTTSSQLSPRTTTAHAPCHTQHCPRRASRPSSCVDLALPSAPSHPHPKTRPKPSSQLRTGLWSGIR